VCRRGVLSDHHLASLQRTPVTTVIGAVTPARLADAQQQRTDKAGWAQQQCTPPTAPLPPLLLTLQPANTSSTCAALVLPSVWGYPIRAHAVLTCMAPAELAWLVVMPRNGSLESAFAMAGRCGTQPGSAGVWLAFAAVQVTSKHLDANPMSLHAGQRALLGGQASHWMQDAPWPTATCSSLPRTGKVRGTPMLVLDTCI
jgi:hypothetical protein